MTMMQNVLKGDSLKKKKWHLNKELLTKNIERDRDEDLPYQYLNEKFLKVIYKLYFKSYIQTNIQIHQIKKKIISYNLMLWFLQTRQ